MNPLGADRYLGVGRGWKKGEHTVTVNGGRRSHVAQGAGTSGGGWWVVGAGDDQGGRRFAPGEELESR